jgi:hypothetical protein
MTDGRGSPENKPMTAAPKFLRGPQTAAGRRPRWTCRSGRRGRWALRGSGAHADRELHVWVKEKLEAGPQGTSKRTQNRLRWVLWRLYAARGPEEVPEGQIPVPPMRRA